MKLSHTNVIHAGGFQKGKICSQHSICTFELYDTEEEKWNLSPWTSSLTIIAPGNTALTGKFGIKNPSSIKKATCTYLEDQNYSLSHTQSGSSSLHTHDKLQVSQTTLHKFVTLQVPILPIFKDNECLYYIDTSSAQIKSLFWKAQIESRNDLELYTIPAWWSQATSMPKEQNWALSCLSLRLACKESFDSTKWIQVTP